MDGQTVQAAVIAGIPLLGCVGGVALYIVRAELRGDVTRLDGRIDRNQALQEKTAEDVSYMRGRVDDLHRMLSERE